MSRENNFFNVENDFEKLDIKYDRSKLNISFNRIAFIFFIFVIVLFTYVCLDGKVDLLIVP